MSSIICSSDRWGGAYSLLPYERGVHWLFLVSSVGHLRSREKLGPGLLKHSLLKKPTEYSSYPDTGNAIVKINVFAKTNQESSVKAIEIAMFN